MARVSKLSDAEISQALASLKGWSVKDGKLHKEYKFADFVHAFGFMATAAMRIERLDHHPEWCNVYNTVRIDLTTHDSGGITGKDVELAGILDALAVNLQ
ncbi:MAG: 4a-hydroxytetrahydrobiopterin dehydratase [Bryobacterales bacterium]|nr:4a-hydroxytetrahydrobiopterin dehydratase [Bryobacterales bacterium]